MVPSTAVFKVEKFADNRSAAWVSLDGANRFLIEDGESIIVEGSQHPLTFVTLKTDNLTDLWSQRLVKFFGWNTRETNKVLKKNKHEQYYRGEYANDFEESKEIKKEEKYVNALPVIVEESKHIAEEKSDIVIKVE